MKWIFTDEKHIINADHVLEMYISGVRFDGERMRWSMICVMTNGTKISTELPECDTEEKARAELKRLVDGLNRR